VGAKHEVSIAIPVPWVIAAPAPCIILPPINTATFGDVVATMEPNTKRVNPDIYTCLRPTISDNLPIGSNKALMVTAYPTITHCTVGRSVENALAIVGRAIMAVPTSITDANVPVAMTKNTHHL
jgi:hypothetical protein